MTAPILTPDYRLIIRRSILIGAAATLFCAPAIVRAANLMPVRRLPFPFGPQYAGFVERLYFHALERSLQAALREGAASGEVCGRSIPVDVARREVAYAQAHGFLPPYTCIYRADCASVRRPPATENKQISACRDQSNAHRGQPIYLTPGLPFCRPICPGP